MFVLFATSLVIVLVGVLVWLIRRPRSPVHPELMARWLDEGLAWRQVMDAAQRDLHTRRAQSILRRVRWMGCAGHEPDARSLVLLAGLAALLCLQRSDALAGLRAVLIYPGAFWVPQDVPDENGLVSGEEVLHSGLSEDNGRVLLSWHDVEQALGGAEHNVALHEFAHQLDAMSGGEGAPIGAPATRWTPVMQRAWAAFEQAPSPVIDDYALEGPAEFFPVAVEAFFQRPAAMRAAHPELFALLADYFGLQPETVSFSHKV